MRKGNKMKTYSTADAALKLGISWPTIRRWCLYYGIGRVETEIGGRPISGQGQRRLTEKDLQTIIQLDQSLRKNKLGRPAERAKIL